MSAIIYTRLNIPNDVFIFWTSWLYLPWVLKMFWAPLVEGNSTKRRWVISMQFALALCFLFIALTLQTSNFFMASVLGFFVGAFLSATHDIALDGFYLLALTEKDQAYFVGWRTVFYRFSLNFISGPLVVLAGKLEKHFSNISLAWTLVLGAVAVFSVILAAYHNFVLPTPASDGPKQQEKKGLAFYGDIFKKYFTQKQIFFILLFIFLYRFGDACLEKVVVPFMLQPLDKGGLALSTETYGYI
ncbi:MAG: MFS transporter, partial [Elusimicrobiaceae bacterium]|nr:MFS transporter [Elusimicrobiaceae bacterium]